MDFDYQKMLEKLDDVEFALISFYNTCDCFIDDARKARKKAIDFLAMETKRLDDDGDELQKLIKGFDDIEFSLVDLFNTCTRFVDDVKKARKRVFEMQFLTEEGFDGALDNSEIQHLYDYSIPKWLEDAKRVAREIKEIQRIFEY